MTQRFEACPDSELIAAYLDGRLTGPERTTVTDHLASCEDCYMLFAESWSTQAEPQSIPTPAIRMWRRVAISAAGLAAAAMLTLTVQPAALSSALAWVRPSNQADVAELVAAAGMRRTLEPRLTGGFTYEPVRSATRSGVSRLDASSPDVRIAVARIEKRMMQSRTPKTLSAAGEAFVAMGDGAQGVAALEEATATGAPEPKALSDLAAAYLLRFTQKSHPEDVARAIAAANTAIKADPSLAEAWFNRALAVERGSSSAEARHAWDDYLRVDSRSGWADEARRHLQALEGFSAKP
jgi:tetratricopeptide (TPR) repeat protein